MKWPSRPARHHGADVGPAASAAGAAGCTSILAGLTAVSPVPTCTVGGEQLLRRGSSNALHRGFAIVSMMITALRTIHARYLIRFGEVIACAIVPAAATAMMAVPGGSGISLDPIVLCGSSGIRSESRLRMRRGHDR